MNQYQQPLSLAEMDRRFDELLALIDKRAYPDAEAFEQLRQQWAERGRPISLRMVKRYYSLVKRRSERGDDLYALAQTHTWSEIIWPPEDQ
jgi:hypothetical protein